MTRKAGRPKVAKSKARSPGISVRLTPDERKPIDTAIKASKLTQSDWARKSLLYVANNGICIT
jgi:Mobilization protein NikA